MADNAVKHPIAPGISRGRRLAIAAGLLAAGIAVQLAFSWIAGAALLLAAGVLLYAPGGSNKPECSPEPGKWEEVTAEEYDRVVGLSAKSKAWGVSFLDINSGRGLVALLMLGTLGLIAGLAIAGLGGIGRGPFPLSRADSNLFLAFLLDVPLLLLPLWISGNETRFTADELVVKIRALQNVVARLEEYPADGWRLRRLMECSRSCGAAVPSDVRLHLVADAGPKDFLGVQVQVSINNVQGTKYPYLYAVVLAKQGFGLFNAEAPESKKDVFEQEHSDDVDVVVVRQHTTKTSGYHTKAADQVRVFEMALACAQNALQNASPA